MFFGLRRVALAVFAAAGLCLLQSSATATSEGTAGVYGANSGSTLQLLVRGKHIVVKGRMAPGRPVGCHYAHHRLIAVCPLRGIGSFTLRMGPSGDMVEVLDPLPVPLTVYLGDGSDKFIGNGESDTCYSEGARRNRCIGGGSDDICITGQQNSDCVGGAGNDYCQTGAGSDGCWGGPGRDVCRMGPGHDGCHGEGGDDRLYGGPSSDQLYGGRDYDRCDGGPGWGRSHGCEAGPRH